MPISPLIRPKIRNRRMGFNSAFLPPSPRPPGAKMSALTLIVPELLLFSMQAAAVISAVIFPATGDIYCGETSTRSSRQPWDNSIAG